jgi:glutaredoxin
MKVKIYVSHHCVSCQDAIHYFKRKGVDFKEIDVTHDQESFNEMLLLGGIATPLIIVGDHIFHTFDPNKVEKVLGGEHE